MSALTRAPHRGEAARHRRTLPGRTHHGPQQTRLVRLRPRTTIGFRPVRGRTGDDHAAKDTTPQQDEKVFTRMTIDWRYTIEQDLGILSVAGYLGPDAARRFTGAVGWAVARGTGPVVVDLAELRGWSAEGQLAITEAARRLADSGRSLELAAIPADGSLVPAADCPDIPVHCDLTAALAAHGRGPSAPAEGQQEWRTDGWPA